MGYSIHKITVIILVLIWTLFQFQSRSKESLSFENGLAKRTGETKNGLNEGIWTWYHSNGKVQMEGNFISGKREGLWKTYDSTGQIRSESRYIKNHLNGQMILFSEKGDTISVKIFEEDRIIR